MQQNSELTSKYNITILYFFAMTIIDLYKMILVADSQSIMITKSSIINIRSAQLKL